MKKSLSIIAIFVTCTILLCSCGSSYSSDSNYSGDKSYISNSTAESDFMYWDFADDMDYEEPDEAYWNTASVPMAPMEKPAAANPATSGGNVDADALKQSQRKIIKNKELSIETLEYDTFTSELQRKVNEFGGYIENSTQNGNRYYHNGLRSSNYTIRIPAERFDEFTSIIGDMATITYTYEYIDDITTKYVDTEARLAALKAERDSFIKLMDKAETIEDILKIQEYLTDVNYQIESYTAQLNTYKSLVSYSTLRLDVSEVERITPQVTARPGVFERIKTNLSENLYNISEGAKDLFVGIVSSSPYLGMLAVIVVIIIIIVKHSKKKAKKAQAEFYAMYANQNASANQNNANSNNDSGKDN